MAADQPLPRALRPIVTHPGFPPLCALWWAIFLGLGIWIIPAELLPHPLALLDHTMLALSLAGIGAVIGLATSRGLRLAVTAPLRRASGQETHLPEELEDEASLRILAAEQLPDLQPEHFDEDEASNDRFEDLPANLRSPLDSRPVEEMGSTELLERLASAVHRYMVLKEVAKD